MQFFKDRPPEYWEERRKALTFHELVEFSKKWNKDLTEYMGHQGFAQSVINLREKQK